MAGGPPLLRTYVRFKVLFLPEVLPSGFLFYSFLNTDFRISRINHIPVATGQLNAKPKHAVINQMSPHVAAHPIVYITASTIRAASIIVPFFPPAFIFYLLLSYCHGYSQNFKYLICAFNAHAFFSIFPVNNGPVCNSCHFCQSSSRYSLLYSLLFQNLSQFHSNSPYSSLHLIRSPQSWQ